MVGYIYKHTNTTTGKVYIGQTTQKLESRWGKEGYNYKDNRQFYRDIVKYGWDGFSHEVLERIEQRTKQRLKEELNKAENYYIVKNKSMLSRYGYNTAVSIDGKGLKLNQAAKRFITRKINQGMSIEEAYKLFKQTRRK